MALPICLPASRLRRFTLLALIIASAIPLSFKSGGLHLYFDAAQYLDSAFHLARYRTFTDADTAAPAPPAIGREPGYPLFLATLMVLDPAFGQFTPDCLKDNSCSPRIFRSVGLANLCLIFATSIVIYFIALRLYRNHWAAWAAAAYLLFNFQMNKGWADPMSDRLAVLWVSVSIFAAVWAWRKKTAAWCCVGLALGALTLTKASFLPYSVLAAFVAGGAALFHAAERRRILASLAAASVVYGVLVGGWTVRNWAVSGQFRFTDLRGGIALDHREILNHMTALQYVAALVYWTRGFGEGAARHLFPAEAVAPFDLYNPNGFYERAQEGYGPRVREIAQHRGSDVFAAAAELDRSLVLALLEHPFRYVMTTPPILYRGIWIDEFAPIGFPIFCWMCLRSLRRRDALGLVALSIGAFNLLFYSMFSQNLPRYQMTAIPSIALAIGMAVAIGLQHHQRTRELRPAIE